MISSCLSTFGFGVPLPIAPTPPAFPRHVVIVGAGIIGLSTAFTIKQKRPDTRITIVAEHLPGDPPSPIYCSPHASSLHLWLRGDGEDGGNDLDWELRTAKQFWQLARKHPGCPILPIKQTTLYEKETAATGKLIWQAVKEGAPWKRQVSASELPVSVEFGIQFETFTVDPILFLLWLSGYLSNSGCCFIRHKLDSIYEASSFNEAGPVEAIVNCTGLGAGDLGGVWDSMVYSESAWSTVVFAPHLKEGKARIGEKEVAFIPRRSGNVAVAYMNHGSGSEAAEDETLSRGQLTVKKCSEVFPEILQVNQKWSDLPIVEEVIAYRPRRTTGVRLRYENFLTKDLTEIPLVHNYGHGRKGYMLCFGSAEDAVELLHARSP